MFTRLGNSLKISAILCIGEIYEIDGISSDELMHDVCNLVVLSMSFLFFISTNKLKLFKKSAPKMGLGTSATMNFQMKFFLKFNDRLIVFVPKVEIVELLAAYNLKLLTCVSLELLGRIETSEPVSTKNVNPELLSFTNNLFEHFTSPTEHDDGLPSFPNYYY